VSFQGFAGRVDVKAGEVLDELRMGVRQPGDPVELAVAGQRLFEVDQALQRLFVCIKGLWPESLASWISFSFNSRIRVAVCSKALVSPAVFEVAISTPSMWCSSDGRRFASLG
jgi:hypothetical protein